jgi:trans-2-enoyl-CoA reductase
MRQIVCTRACDDPIEAIALVEAPEPECPPAGVIVQVRARPINPADLLLLTGRHVYRPDYPAPIGIEGAGEVIAVGPASRLRVGDRVAIPSGGTWRERMAADDDALLPLPPDVDLEQAAMLSVNPFTAAGLLEGLGAGACVALNAGTSAISALILAMARARGLVALAVVRDGATEASVRAKGAHAVLVDGPDLAERLRAAAPGPIVRALDAVAGDASGRLFDAVAEGGELVVYGLLADDQVRLPAARVVFRDVIVRGYSRLRSLRALAQGRRAAITAELVDLLARGELTTAIEARYPLTEAAPALAHHGRPGRAGKILLIS